MNRYLHQFRLLFSPREKRRFVLLVGLMVISALLEMLGIGLLVGIAVVFLDPASELAEQIASGLSIGSSEQLLMLFLAVAAAGFALKTLYSYGVIRLGSSFIYRQGAQLSGRIFANYLASDYEVIAEEAVSDLTLQLRRCSDFCTLVLMPELQFLSDLLVIILTVAVLVFFMPLATLGGGAALLLTGLAVYWLTRRLNLQLGMRYRAAEADSSALSLAALSDLAYLKSTGDTEALLTGYCAAFRKQSECLSRLYTLGQLPRLLIECFVFLLLIAGLWLMLKLDVERTTVVLTFSALAAVLSRLLPALSRAHYNLTLLRQNRHLFLQLADEATQRPLEKTCEDAEKRPEFHRELAIREISYTYRGTERPVIDQLSAVIPFGSCCGIVGKTGCGKSTLLEILLGLRRPDAGSITADGVDIFKNLKFWRSQIGYVPQEIRLKAGTVRENVAGNNTDIDDAKVRRALALAQLTELDIDRVVLPDDGNLSGGQKQRLGIARALYRDIRLLILDEATSALDRETETALTAALNSLKGQLTMIIVAHRLSTLEQCDCIIDLNRSCE